MCFVKVWMRWNAGKQFGQKMSSEWKFMEMVMKGGGVETDDSAACSGWVQTCDDDFSGVMMMSKVPVTAARSS